jgi:hypothetical protein
MREDDENSGTSIANTTTRKIAYSLESVFSCKDYSAPRAILTLSQSVEICPLNARGVFLTTSSDSNSLLYED